MASPIPAHVSGGNVPSGSPMDDKEATVAVDIHPHRVSVAFVAGTVVPTRDGTPTGVIVM